MFNDEHPSAAFKKMHEFSTVDANLMLVKNSIKCGTGLIVSSGLNLMLVKKKQKPRARNVGPTIASRCQQADKPGEEEEAEELPLSTGTGGAGISVLAGKF